ncbi:hypothetical protein POJ06DRAFT_263820 [Lipomyces tetrasporus]|uniref:Uncharacterized protein n=1 Tax=Lipomyces tetrasporus TaxID=54092 RepID=A0AAD7QMC7_9ASCO|nr:uncharacterized protein POJ06DRAFT_263820 [Lipomyces tetrasporus]KAJ8096542.1 hypothetical protein POJ06DRAFT_263820 [Lipomyces tetrasporus]
MTLREQNFTLGTMKSGTSVWLIFFCLCLGLRAGAAVVQHCHSCGGVPTPSTSVLDVSIWQFPRQLEQATEIVSSNI